MIFGFTIPWNVLVPALVVPGFMFTAMGAYPFIEQWVTGDKREHHVLDRPRNVPTRTGLGVMSITFFLILLAGGANDILATTFHMSINCDHADLPGADLRAAADRLRRDQADLPGAAAP